eukprot:4675363-Prymnesium_polylepis.1
MASRRSDLDRTTGKAKSGVFTGYAQRFFEPKARAAPAGPPPPPSASRHPDGDGAPPALRRESATMDIRLRAVDVRHGRRDGGAGARRA